MLKKQSVMLFVSFAFVNFAVAQVAPRWITRHNPFPRRDSFVEAMYVDSSGNTYLAGYTLEESIGYYYHGVVAKFDSDGRQLWSVEGARGAVNALSVDDSGNMFTAGWELDQDGETLHSLTVKYDTNGNKLWEGRYTNPFGYDEEGDLIGTDSMGNVYVGGRGNDQNGRARGRLMKYSPDGQRLWVHSVFGPGPITAMKVTSTGNIYAVGDAGEAIEITQFDSQGSLVWFDYYISDVLTARSFAAALDRDGDLYVAGYSAWDQSSWSDYAVLKYGGGGGRQWVGRYDGPAHERERATMIVVDSNKNVYVTGRSENEQQREEIATVKFDPSGQLIWSARYGIPDSANGPTGIVLDHQNNVVVTGGAGWSNATLKYDASGNRLWLARYRGKNGTDGWARAVGVDAVGSMYVVAGSASGRPLVADLIKYVPAVPPTTFEVVRGSVKRGSLAELALPDDEYLVTRDKISDRTVAILVTAISPIKNPVSLVVDLESSSEQGGPIQSIEMWDFTKSAYVTVDTRRTSPWDSTAIVETSSPARFVDPSSGEIRARLAWILDRPTITPYWELRVDQVAWIVN
ncbi:MAG: hypothetical protein WAO58_05495 [Fimbriimonadaceae bacterium]